METKIRHLSAITNVTANIDVVGFCIYEIDCISGDERGDFHICRDLDGTETLASILADIKEKVGADGGCELAGHITTVHGICLEFHCDAAELWSMLD